MRFQFRAERGKRGGGPSQGENCSLRDRNLNTSVQGRIAITKTASKEKKNLNHFVRALRQELNHREVPGREPLSNMKGGIAKKWAPDDAWAGRTKKSQWKPLRADLRGTEGANA